MYFQKPVILQNILRRPCHTLLVIGLFFSVCHAALGQPNFELPHPVSDRPLTLQTITPADVLSRIKLVQAELEALRLRMGKPKIRESKLVFDGANLREVFFQANALFEKANQLALEQTGQWKKELEHVPALQIQLFHVWNVVNAALERLLLVRDKLEERSELKEPFSSPSTTLTDTLRAMVSANRQIHLLLKRPISSREIFREVTLSVNYAARLLATFPSSQPYPTAPPIQHAKTKADIFQHLFSCYESVQFIAQRSGEKILPPRLSDTFLTDASWEEIYDVATLLKSELAYLHSLNPHSLPLPIAYDPGRKFPSEVDQRLRILEAQLVQLREQVEKNPEWLKF